VSLLTCTLKVSVNGEEISTKGKPITESDKVRYIMSKFGSKYG
jgi:ribosome-associated protein YbcJ (S4-like RNA binding protein)